MTEGQLSVSVRMAGQGVAVIQVRGELKVLAEKTLMDAFSEATSAGAQIILFNFSELEYMNSSGIGLLVTLLMRANRAGQRLAACCMNHHYLEIFNITGLDMVFTIYTDEAEALKAFQALEIKRQHA